MLTRDDVRRIALALPEADEADHHGIPAFRVRKKIFCTIHLDEPRAMLKLNAEDQHNLCDGASILPVPGYWGRKGSTFVYFERLEPDRLQELVRLAWATVAPKSLVKGAA